MEQFEVIFYDDDEKTVLDHQVVNRGDPVKYKGKKPHKEPINQINYVFIGWSNEDKMNSIQENLTLVAKYIDESLIENKEQQALMQALLENTKKTSINSTMRSGNKLTEQHIAIEKDNRTIKEIVADVLKNGKTEIGQEISKQDEER